MFFFFFSSRRRHTRSDRDWSSDVCSSDLASHAIMAGHHAEHARQTATLRWVALGILIPNTFFIEAALGRFARCRYSAIQNNVQTNTYDPRRHGATPSLLSCRQSQTLVL